MKIGTNDISKLYLGSAEIEKIYLGTEQVYGGSEPTPVPFEEQYLTFDIVSGGTINWVAKGSQPRTISYSLDGGDSWSSITSSTAVTSFNVNAGDKVLWKGTNTNYATNPDNYSSFSGSTATFNIEGNIMSTLYGDNFTGQTALTDTYAFAYFLRTINVISAENLILPTGLSNYCFWYLFKDCTSLITAPQLPATTLVNACYIYMFGGCTSLTTAPELPATTLVNACYNYMFSGCTSLNYIKCLATNTSAGGTNQWVNGVASTGTFVKAASMSSWTTGNNGIPNGWVVENEGDLPYNAQYLTIESLVDNNTISLVTTNTATTRTISASTDNGATWTAYTSTIEGTPIATLNAGDKVLIKGENSQYSTNNTRYNYFTSAGQFNVYGNIMSLISGDSFENADTLTGTYTFFGLFKEATELTSAENLILPATTLASNCYFNMFKGCTSLTTAPALPATTVASNCYKGMFRDCTSLTTAPELPATTLANYCYTLMFNGCTNLNYIKCLATNISGSNYTANWVSGVASSGTFVKAASMSSWTTGSDGIPDGWTVQNDDGSPV